MSAETNGINFRGPFDWASMPAVLYPNGEDGARTLSILPLDSEAMPWNGGPEVWSTAVDPGPLCADALNNQLRAEIPDAHIIDLRNRGYATPFSNPHDICELFTVVLEQVSKRRSDAR